MSRPPSEPNLAGFSTRSAAGHHLPAAKSAAHSEVSTGQVRAHDLGPGVDADDAEDRRIVAAIQNGDITLWGELVSRYQDRLYSMCVRMVTNRDMAQDLTQDAFVKLIQGLGTYDGRSRFSTWAIRVTMNVCLSRLRAEKLRRHPSIEAIGEKGFGGSGSGAGAGGGGGEGPGRDWMEDREPNTVQGVEAHEDRRLVLEAIRELDPDQRAVLILCDCHGQSYEAIAMSLGVAVGTVKSRLFRARAALRDAVEAIAASRVQPGGVGNGGGSSGGGKDSVTGSKTGSSSTGYSTAPYTTTHPPSRFPGKQV